MRPKSKSSTTTDSSKLPPVHPGEVLSEEFLKPMGISQYRLAKDTSVPPRRINEIVLKKRSITADTALRLGRYFGTSEQFWLNLQSEYELDVERDRLGNRLEAEVIQMARPAREATGDSPSRRISTMRRSKA
jgi:addiction module HigA family antidote